MTNDEKAEMIAFKNGHSHYCENCDDCCRPYDSTDDCFKSAMQMAQWKDEQLGWHNAKKEQPPMDEDVIVLTNTLNGKELSTPMRICFGHIVNKEYCVDYDGWNIPGVAYWMRWNEPIEVELTIKKL